MRTKLCHASPQPVPQSGNSLVLFEASKIVTRAAINEQERMQYGEIVLIVDSRSQQLGQLRCVRRKRGAGPRSNAAPKSRFSNVRRSTRPSKDNKVQPLMSAGPKSKTPSGACVPRRSTHVHVHSTLLVLQPKRIIAQFKNS